MSSNTQDLMASLMGGGGDASNGAATGESDLFG
eukprot:CAMPEP_0172467962 /NCGR_PEP_ID=MMETSP1065-20121228/60279_1 /TAXON_ID=265537 /ORGANISM="Amphiprora paludosa, Strain CCMP125" /LENGTH=32 /DNA_ID= /DNA_START= /DNA_END= /DNA_ORIENTATION=